MWTSQISHGHGIAACVRVTVYVLDATPKDTAPNQSCLSICSSSEENCKSLTSSMSAFSVPIQRPCLPLDGEGVHRLFQRQVRNPLSRKKRESR
jgi:hypothetical protein